MKESSSNPTNFTIRSNRFPRCLSEKKVVGIWVLAGLINWAIDNYLSLWLNSANLKTHFPLYPSRKNSREPKFTQYIRRIYWPWLSAHILNHCNFYSSMKKPPGYRRALIPRGIIFFWWQTSVQTQVRHELIRVKVYLAKTDFSDECQAEKHRAKLQKT